MKRPFHVDSRLFTYVAIVYMELILKLFTCNEFFNMGLIFMPLFSLVPFGLITAVSKIFRSKKAKKTVLVVAFSFLFILFATQTTYHMFFNKYLIFYSLTVGGAAQVIAEGLVESTIKAIVDSLPAIILLSLPLVAICLFSHQTIIHKSPRKKGWFKYFVLSLVLHFALTTGISFIPYFSDLQSSEFDPNLSVAEFGLLRTEVLDAKYNLFGAKPKVTFEDESNLTKGFHYDPEVEYNVLDLDFSSKDGKFKELNNYLANSPASKKNEYTGMYKGYNLILVTAEGFSPYAVDEKLTPTLYKMSTEGFKFNNFYTPIWGVSTSDGEYTICTGLIPKSGIWSFYTSGKNYMPFGLGNMFRGVGIDKTFAYHNNTYNYYHRDISHPNLGYTYKGYGNGLEQHITKQWPQSDLEMLEGSMTDYLSDDKPFHAYYMTVSGHLDYDPEKNDIAAKNWDKVHDLDCSDTLKAYYACNIELDKAMEKLVSELKAAGVYEKTVIAITPDHYPYGLEQDNADKYAIWEELLGRPVEENFELYKSNFILFCGGTENAPTIDKYCSSLDILPTLLNLFGFDFDSRLLMGRDILSDSEALVILSDRSFITSKGKYNATTDEFYPFNSDDLKDEDALNLYVESAKSIVKNKFTASAQILTEDYYRYIMKKS